MNYRVSYEHGAYRRARAICRQGDPRGLSPTSRPRYRAPLQALIADLI